MSSTDTNDEPLGADYSSMSFGQWLKRRRKQYGYTQEELAQRAGCSVATVQRIEEGVRRPSRQLAELIAEALELQPQERPAFVQWSRTQPLKKEVSSGRGSGGSDPKRGDGESNGGVETQKALANPYKGLSSFYEADAPDFFGREDLTSRLIARLCEGAGTAHFLAVVGPSGSGKSSLVRAGLLPTIRRTGLPAAPVYPLSSDGQPAPSSSIATSTTGPIPVVVDMVPGTHPLEELEAGLLRVAANPPPSLMEQLRDGSRGLLRAAKRVLPAPAETEGGIGAGLLLFIDQFEEVFTLARDGEARMLLDSLYEAAVEARSPVWVIVTIRADFYDRPLMYSKWCDLLRDHTELVGPMSGEELHSAIVGPAERVGVGIEPALVAAIQKDVDDQPGMLPLMEYALTELFEQRDGSHLTLEAYRASGGVRGALARRSEEIYARLSPAEQEEAQRLFGRLVTLGEGVEDTRRRALRAELASAAANEEALDRVLEAFGRYRLLTFDRDLLTHGPTVEIAHEALIRNWGRLQEWLEGSRADLRVQRQLMSAASEWAGSGKEAGYLASGSRLAQFELLAQVASKPGSIALTGDEKGYLAASLEERDRQAKTERDRQARELHLQKRAASRLRYLVVGLAIFLVVATILSGFAVNRSQAADDNAREAGSAAATAEANQQEADTQKGLALQSQATAQANFTRAEAQRLAGEANTLILKDGSTETIALLSIRSMRTQYSAQGDAALDQASTLPYPSQIFIGHTAEVDAVAFSPDGKYVLTGSFDKTAKLWDAKTGKEVRTFTGHTDAIESAAFSPDGKYVATAGADSTARVWDVQTGKELLTLMHDNILRFVTFSPDNRYLLTGGRDKIVRLWDLRTGKEVREFTGHGAPVLTGAFTSDGKYIITGSRDGTARIWNVQTSQDLHDLKYENDQIYSVAFSPDGKYAAAGTINGIAGIWDVQSGTEVLHIVDAGGNSVNGVAFSPDGRTLAGACNDNLVRFWDVATGKELRHFTGFTAGVLSVAFSPDGRYIVAGSIDKTAQSWEPELPDGLPHYPGGEADTSSLGYSPDGKYVLVTGAGGTILWDAQTGQQLRTFGGNNPLNNWAAFSPDGKYVLTGSGLETATLWDTQTGQEIRHFGPTDTDILGLAFSPDGRYMATSHADGTARQWDTQSGQLLRTFPAQNSIPLEVVTFSPDSKFLLTAGDDTMARLWDVQTGQLVHTLAGHAGVIWGLAFSPDGKYVLTGSADQTARLWDVQTASSVVTYTGHTAAIYQVAFSPDGKYVLTGGYDDTRLWNAQTGLELRRFPGGTGVAAFSPDGKYVLSASSDNMIRTWYVDYHDTMNYLCGRLLRDFSDDERRQFNIVDNKPTCPAK